MFTRDSLQRLQSILKLGHERIQTTDDCFDSFRFAEINSCSFQKLHWMVAPAGTQQGEETLDDCSAIFVRCCVLHCIENRR